MWNFHRLTAVQKPPRAGRCVPPQVEALEGRLLLDAARFVRGLYDDVLRRAASQAEVDSWVQVIHGGARREDVVHAFVESTEHRMRVIRDDYQQFLGRTPSSGEVTTWANLMASGVREDQVEAAFLASAEYQQHHGGTDDGFVSGLYQDVLHRGADDAGKAAWLALLHSGMTHDQVAAGIVSSHEAHSRVTDALYSQMLHRGADDAGRHWAEDALDHGTRSFQLQEAMADSTEYSDDHGGFDG